MIDIKYKKIYDKFIEYYKNTHVNPWHEIEQEDLKKIYEKLISSMEINSKYTFKYFIDYIIKHLSGKKDAHTMLYMVELLPMNFKIIDEEILVNYPISLKGACLKKVNGIDIKTIIEELECVITYGTDGKRRYELESALFNKAILFGLPSFRNSEELSFELETHDGMTLVKTFKKDEQYLEDEIFNYDEHRYGNNATYQFIDNCLIYVHSSVQNKFKEKIEAAITNLKQEDLSTIEKIIIDIRGNIGGNAALNKVLIDFLSEYTDKLLIVLTDYRVFSGGRYALRDLINLGAIAIGEEISTPMNCYGNSNWINIDNYYFSVSEHYYHPIDKVSFTTKDEYNNGITPQLLNPYIFKPDIYVNSTKEDFIKDVDSILNAALEYEQLNILK